MREVGLLDVDSEARGSVGRPQHRYSLAADAPALGLEPSPFPMLARMLLAAAAAGRARRPRSWPTPAGSRAGPTPARGPTAPSALEALIVEQARLGFDPEVVDDDDGATMAFAHCPFRELAEAHPDLVCRLHCGLVEGLVDELRRRRGRRVPHASSTARRARSTWSRWPDDRQR